MNLRKVRQNILSHLPEIREQRQHCRVVNHLLNGTCVVYAGAAVVSGFCSFRP